MTLRMSGTTEKRPFGDRTNRSDSVKKNLFNVDRDASDFKAAKKSNQKFIKAHLMEQLKLYNLELIRNQSIQPNCLQRRSKRLLNPDMFRDHATVHEAQARVNQPKVFKVHPKSIAALTKSPTTGLKQTKLTDVFRTVKKAQMIPERAKRNSINIVEIHQSTSAAMMVTTSRANQSDEENN